MTVMTSPAKMRGQTVTYNAGAGTAQPTGTRVLDDQNVFIYRMRVHRDIVPC